MKPADLIIQVRQRNEWEAIDLGFALVQTTWRQLFPAWTIILVLFSACLWLLVPLEYSGIAGLLLWWLKPLYDRVLLHILSRSLFGQRLTVAEVFSALPGLIFRNGLPGSLLWRRFSFSRSYNLPVWQLEGLRGKARLGRHQLLYLQGHGHAIGLTLVCFFLQFIVAVSLYSLLVLLDPTGQVWEYVRSLFSFQAGEVSQRWLALGDYVTHVIAILLIEPFFVAGGFALYLNRRTQLEAWDLEIAFRSMGERLQALADKSRPVAVACLLGLSVSSIMMFPAQPLMAADTTEYLSPYRLPVSETAAQMEQVMQVEELSQKREVSFWMARDRNKEEEDDDNTSDPFEVAEELIQAVASLFEWMLWALVLVAVVMAVVYRKKLLAMLKPYPEQSRELAQPDVLFGMDIRPQSLPDDIAGAARTLWQQQQYREALGLLYRGALMLLTRRDKLAIADSHTEGDILGLAQGQISSERFQYLRDITRCWQTVAYAHRMPEFEQVEPLWLRWGSFEYPHAPEKPEKSAGEGQSGESRS